MQSEKWAAYLILVFILIVASFNMLGSLSMLIIDKKEDLFILRGMGADSKLIRQIFLFEGWLISFFGAVIGSLLGIFISWLQIKYELVSLPGAGSFIITAYPVKIILSDILIILGVVLGIGFIASWYPVKFISHKYICKQICKISGLIIPFLIFVTIYSLNLFYFVENYHLNTLR
jgi:lipoprotein-releasing system permease protein